MVEWFKNPNYNFIGNRNKAFVFSAILMLITIASMVVPIYPGRGVGLNLAIDFTGGTVVQLKFANPVAGELGKIRQIADGLGYGKPEVKTIGLEGDNEVQILIKRQKDPMVFVDGVKAALQRDYAENPFETRRVESVGPKVGSELGRAAFISVVLSLLVIIVYVGARFSFPFGLAGVIALAHDVMVPIGLFSVLNMEITLPFIAALLTIAGYSINDTIVIFDRIRENMGESISRASFADKVNTAVNQTLSRTVITSSTSLLCVLAVAVLFFGSGDVVFDFSLALFAGFISGVYSTVFIASPIVVLWNNRWPIKRI